jgi:NDP-sugar pyrophosphorylase family protein
MAVKKVLTRNDHLFELNRAEELNIPKELKEFLEKTEFPWLALGKPLTAFVQTLVDAVPVQQRRLGKISPHACLEGDDIVVCEGAIIEPGAYVLGPTYIAPGAIIRHGAYVRGSVLVCSQAVVGHTTEVKGSVLLPKAKAAHFAYVGDSLLGYDTNLGAGTKLANLRLDHGIVKVRVEEEKITTSLKKFGAIFGNRAQSGCNAVTNPGTILLPDAIVLPNSTSLGIVVCKK